MARIAHIQRVEKRVVGSRLRTVRDRQR